MKNGLKVTNTVKHTKRIKTIMKTMTLIITVILTVSAVYAQSVTLKVEGNTDGGKQIDVLATSGSTFGYACASKNWSEAYVGKVFSPAAWLEIAAGLGLEDAKNPVRLGGWVWLGEGRVSFIHLFEDGGSGEWHKSIAAYQISDSLKAGLIDRAFYGRGITAEYKLGNGSKLNGAVYEGGKATLSLSHSF